MHPNENKEVAVNDTVIISCNVSSIQNLSLFINNTLVNSKNAAIIKYKFTSDKPNVYSFKCTSLKMEYFVKITFRIPPVVVSARAQIFSLNEQICHMVVNFTLQHFRKFDYIKISRSENGREMQLCSNNSVCQFKCLLFHLYAFNVQIITSNFPMYSENWEFRASKKFYKLAKLTEFKLSEVRSESLNLSYGVTNHHDKLLTVSPFICLYRIFYSSEWGETPKNFTTSETEIVLENLVPYTTYTIEIQAKLNESLYWSDKLILKEKTLPSAPYAGPKSTNGSYLEIPCIEKYTRCFILYWAMIAKPLRNGILDGYVIQQNGKSLFETKELFIKINDQPQNEELWFEIRAKTNDYQYSPPTTIHIPPKAPERPRAVTVVQLNNTHFNISWALQQSQENETVTVMSCLGEKAGSIFWCKSYVMWTKIKNQNFTILKAPKATNFAVSVSNSEGSSSLIFAKCLLSGGIAKTPPKPVILKRYPYKMKLQWPLFDCNELNGRPTLFQVLYAEGNNCTNGLELNIPAIGIKPETEKTEIKNLKPFTNYSVCLKIHTEEGWGQISPQIKIATLETNPSSVRNLQVTNITSGSVTLKWDPALQPNGIITEYSIDYTKLGGSSYQMSSTSNMANVSHLSPYSKYNFAVSSCNKAGCSMEPHYISAKTLIGNTAVIDLHLKIINESILQITWKPPSFLKEHIPYYKLMIIDGKKEIIKTVNDTKYNMSISCQTDDTSKRVNVTAVLKNGTSMIYGESTISQIICPESEKLWITILVGIFGFLLIAIITFCCINWISKNTKEIHILANIPDVKCDNIYSEIDNTINNTVISTTNSDSQTKLIQGMNSDKFEEKEMLITKCNNTNNNNSGEILEMGFIPANIRQKEDHRQRNLPQLKFNQTNQDLNGYIISDVSTSELNQDNSDSNNQGTENIVSSYLNSINIDSKDLFELNQSNSDSIASPEFRSASLDSNGYACNEMNSSEFSQVTSDSDNYVQNNINSSELSQTSSDTNNYKDTASFELKSLNLDSNGYIYDKMNCSELSHANSDSNSHRDNPVAVSELNCENLDSNGYICNEVNSSELSQANSDLDSFEHNNVNIYDLSQVNSDSDNYVQNCMNSSNSDSNGYVHNNADISELSQAESGSNKYKDKHLASSELSDGYLNLNANKYEIKSELI